MGKVLLRSGKEPWQVQPPGRVLERNVLGTNAGNLLFSSSVQRTLTTHDVKVVSNHWVNNPEKVHVVNEKYDAYVVPLANAFRLSWVDHLERLTDFIKQLTIPVVVVGVGAQTSIEGDPARLGRIDTAVRDFVAAVLDRSATLGVRGEFTADYVRGLGFEDVEVIGCPSMYLWGDQLPVERLHSSLPADAKLSMSISPYVKEIGPIVMRHHAAYPDLTYIAQDDVTFAKLMTKAELNPQDLTKHSDVPLYLNHPLFQEDKVLLFVDPWPWIDYLRGRDFSFGTRLHGSIAAILAGTPAHLLVHDSRTLELARYHELPHQMMAQVTPDVDARDLYELADFTAAHRGHSARFAAYLAFLERNGLRHAYMPGESPHAFDRAVARAHFPPAVRMSQVWPKWREPSRVSRRLGTLKRRFSPV